VERRAGGKDEAGVRETEETKRAERKKRLPTWKGRSSSAAFINLGRLLNPRFDRTNADVCARTTLKLARTHAHL
jgi:phage terminase small subunit